MLKPLAPGDVFAHDFVVVQPLAEGGMGAVYVVEQQSTRQRRALKLLKPANGGALDPRTAARFEQEAQVAAVIPSEHVVQVLAAGVEDGTPWLVMELLDGEDLATRLERAGTLAPAEARELFAQLGHGLAAAHGAGIVHRDLKPENVFIARSLRAGATFTVKLLDFGIAQVLAPAATSAHTGSVIGSPLWMAPEQLNAQPLRPSTDVWALGLIAFTALTGRLYWEAANQDDASLSALMSEQLFAPIVPAHDRAAALGCDPRALPAGFDAWFARAVVREPAERFRDAAEATAALLAVFDGPPVSLWPAAKPFSLPPSAMRDATGGPGFGTTAFEQATSRMIPPPPAVAPRRAGNVPLVLAVGAFLIGLVAVANWSLSRSHPPPSPEAQRDDKPPRPEPPAPPSPSPTIAPPPALPSVGSMPSPALIAQLDAERVQRVLNADEPAFVRRALEAIRRMQAQLATATNPLLRTNLESGIRANARAIEVQTSALEQMQQYPMSPAERAHYAASLRSIREYLAANHYPP